MSSNFKYLALLGLSFTLSNNALASNVIKTANCFDVSYYEETYDEETGRPLPANKPILGIDPWNNKITDYKKAMELRLKDDGTIDVVYDLEKEPYGTYTPYLLENTFLNYRSQPDWQGQPVYFDWGKSILQLKNIKADDYWDENEIPLIGEYFETTGHEQLERDEQDSGFVSYSLKDKNDSNKEIRFSYFSTMYRPYIDSEGNMRRYAGDGTFCMANQLEEIYQELKLRQDFIHLKAPKKLMTKEEVKSEVEGKLVKSILCPQEKDEEGYEILSSQKCEYIHNVIYSGLLRINSYDLLIKNPEVKDLINKDIRIGNKYDYEIYDDDTDTWSYSPEVENAIFISPETDHYYITEELLKAIKGEEW